jgi:glycosyltransferase involved in cell wall biosynthesis
MNVLVVVARDAAHPLAAGGDRHMTYFAQVLAEAGNSVTVLTSTHPSLPRQEREGGLQIMRVAAPRLMFPVIWALLLTSQHARFDVVVEESMGGERAPFFGRFLSGSPTLGFWYQDNRSLVSAIYGRAASVFAGWIQSLLLRASRYGWAITNSQSTKNWLMESGFSREKVAVFTPYLDFAQAPTKSPPFSERRNRMMAIGNFRATKRFEEALAVLQKIRKDVPDADLILVGREQDSSYMDKLKRIVSESGLAESVQFCVGASEAKKFELLSSAKVLTIHSPIEGFGWTVIEAGLCGVPTVGNTGVSTDSLRDRRNGRRVGFGDVDAYVGVILPLLKNSAYWESLSRGAREVASEYSSGPLNPELGDLLAQCAGSRRRTSPRSAR